MDVQAIKLAAVARMRARQLEPVYKVVGRCSDGSDMRWQTGGWPGDFAPPADAGEWFNDQLAMMNGPFPDVQYLIADAARAGRGAAVAAVAAARTASAWDQFFTFFNLSGWRPSQGAEPVMRAILAEWRRLGLRDERPDDPIPVITVNQADIDAANRRRRDRRAKPVLAGVLPWE